MAALHRTGRGREPHEGRNSIMDNELRNSDLGRVAARNDGFWNVARRKTNADRKECRLAN
uniref:Uncharacterized protein n=1 Tax=Cucumis melo TaxID=3656 RepID=A0A9I9CG61_CUCME